MTNEEWIKSLDTERLAEFISMRMYYTLCTKCPAREFCEEKCKEIKEDSNICINVLTAWLKQEHK